jgi:hypothetical protein
MILYISKLEFRNILLGVRGAIWITTVLTV